MNRINPNYKASTGADRFPRPWTPSSDLSARASALVARVCAKIAERKREAK